MGARSFCQEKDALVKALRKHPCAFAQQTGNSSCAQFSLTHCFDFRVPCSQMECRVQKRAHPDLNQGPADLQSAALTTELCTQLQRGPCHPRDRVYGTHFSSHRLRVLKWALCSLDDFQQRRRGFGASSLASIGRERERVCVCVFVAQKLNFRMVSVCSPWCVQRSMSMHVSALLLDSGNLMVRHFRGRETRVSRRPQNRKQRREEGFITHKKNWYDCRGDHLIVH